MKRQAILALGFIFLSVTLGITPRLFAGVVYTRLIDTSFIMTQWYDYVSGTDGHLNFNNTSINGSKVLYTHDDVYTLNMTGSLTFNPILERDFSAGAYARGYFEGGVAVTITGGLKIGTSYVYGGTGTAAKPIFQAVLSPLSEDSSAPSQERWALTESTTEAGRFDRTLFLDLIEGSEGLAAGIALQGTGDILKMVGPKMDLSLKTTSTVSNFYTDMGPSTIASPIKITGIVPEPATAVLLGLGSLCFLKRKSMKK